MGKGKELFERFVENYRGNYDSEELILAVEDITENEETLEDSFGSDRLYSIFGAVRDLLEEEIKKKTGETPNLRVIDRLWDFKDSQGLIYDRDKKAVLVDEEFKYLTSPWDLGAFVKTLARIYNEAVLSAKSLYGVELEPIDPEDMLKEVEELINEAKEELSEEDYGPDL